MSSFEHFKKSRLSNRSDSRQSFKSFEQELHNLDNVSFSTSEIVFVIQEGQEVLVNEDLKVTNRTGSRLYFRIKSNNPQYYDMRPTQDILQINAVLPIYFRLNVRKAFANSTLGNTSQKTVLDRLVENNAFEFAWGEITEQNIRNNETPKTNNKQVFKVKVEEPPLLAPILSQRKTHSSAHSKEQPSHSANDLRMYSLDKENTEISQGEYSSLLTIPIIAGVAFLSFVIGYVSA